MFTFVVVVVAGDTYVVVALFFVVVCRFFVVVFLIMRKVILMVMLSVTLILLLLVSLLMLMLLSLLIVMLLLLLLWCCCCFCLLLLLMMVLKFDFVILDDAEVAFAVADADVNRHVYLHEIDGHVAFDGLDSLAVHVHVAGHRTLSLHVVACRVLFLINSWIIYKSLSWSLELSGC